jgi:aspartate aminotransferase
MSAFFAPRVGRIKHSPSNAAGKMVQDMRAQGRDVIGLTIGEPHFTTPDNVKRAAVTAIERNQTRYTAADGSDELKDAVRVKFKRDNGLDFARGEVTTGNGAKQMVFNAMVATLTPGDEVLIPVPAWVSYVDITLVADGVPMAIECSEARGFKLTPEQLDAAITPRTKWLILNSPSNPTGAVYSRSELAALAEVLLRHPHVWVLTDDIYEHLLFDGREYATIAQVEPHLRDRTLTVNGVSKAYAMPGWRVGFAGGPAELIRNMAKLQSQSTSNPCSISQAAAVEALTGPQDVLRPRAAELQRLRDLLVPALNETRGLTCSTPGGAFYVFFNCGGVLGRKAPDGRVLQTEQDFTLYLIENGVAGIPGEAYGVSPYVRFSYAIDFESLKEACVRVQRACAALF